MKSLPIIIMCSLSLVLLSNSIVAQGLEGEWQIKESTVIGLLDSTVLFSRDSPDNVIDLSNISYQFNADGSYEGTDILGNPMSGTWSQTWSTVIIDEQMSSFQEINENEMAIYFNCRPLTKSASAGFAGSYLTFVRASPNSTSSSVEDVGTTLTVRPNPFTDIAVAEFTTPEPLAGTRLDVFNTQGQRILSQEAGYYPSGSHQIRLDLSQRPGGMYFLVLTTESRMLSTKAWKR
ncbi:MAG: T9SS type A sorting domain-containing protein [Bacteroidetes bacterium]|jgi:hypothetical protein|nr:T9SS type A sorting domain-containing protein [Bacteroidota bacterium]